MKAGRILFDSFAKTDVKANDKFKGCSSVIAAFLKTLKSVSTKFNVSGVLKFSHNGKDHDLASAPERTTVQELFEYNKGSIWSFDSIVSVDSIPINLPKPKLFCKVFEDNEACISMVTSVKFTPHTKHIALKYHHFKSWVDRKLINIIHVGTNDQLADMLTKPLELKLFQKFRYDISG